MKNFVYVNESFATADQPVPEDFNELAKKGYTAIVNLSPVSTPNFLPDEAYWVALSKMIYVHYPIDCSILFKKQYELFASIIKGLKNEKVLIHCGGNVKSSGFLYLYQILSLHEEKETVLKTLLKAQKPDPQWTDFFRTMNAEL